MFCNKIFIIIILYIAVRETGQTDDTYMYTWAIVGGGVAVVLILSITTVLTVIVVVAVLKRRSGKYSTGACTRRWYVYHGTSNRLSTSV